MLKTIQWLLIAHWIKPQLSLAFKSPLIWPSGFSNPISGRSPLTASTLARQICFPSLLQPPSLCPPLSLFPAQGLKRELKRACGEKFGEDGNSSNTQRGWLTKCHTWKVWEQEQKAGDKEAKAEVVLAWPHGLATARGSADLWM